MTQIKSLELSEPVHAECKNPAFSARDLIGIDIGQSQSVSMTAINLGVDVSFHAVEVSIAGQPFEMSLAAATLKIFYDNASVIAGKKYNKILQAGSIEEKNTTKSEKEKGRSLGMEGSVGIAAALKARISGDANFKKSQVEVDLDEVQHQIALVEPAGQDSWKIGGPNGHPYVLTKDLRGWIVSSVNSDDALTPLCGLSAREEGKPVLGRIDILASITDFRLTAKDQPIVRRPPQEAYETIEQGLSDDKKAYTKRAQNASLMLKERVAVLAALKPLMRRDNGALLPLAEREFAVVPYLPEAEDQQ